jgi:hypothetical protein
MKNRRCSFKYKNLMVAQRYARTFHCEKRATVLTPDHYVQGRLRNWLCDYHAADVKSVVALPVIAEEVR